MNTRVIISSIALLAGSLAIVHAGAKEEVGEATKKLASADNYSWKSSSKWGGGDRTREAGGKTAKDGVTLYSTSFRDNKIEIVAKGDKAAIKSSEDGWKSLAELEKEREAQSDGDGRRNRGRFFAGMLRNIPNPAKQAGELLGKVESLTLADGVYSGKLTEKGVKSLLSFRRRRGGDDEGPQVSNGSGSVKFWLKEGVVSNYEYSVKGTMSFNGQDRDIQRTSTITISDVGSTKVEVPEGAKSKLSE